MEWNGFHFPMGFFTVFNEKGEMRFGKCDPITKEVLDLYQYKMENGEQVLYKICDVNMC